MNSNPNFRPRSVDRFRSWPTDEQSKSTFANDPMTRLWQNAQDRETGAEAVEEIRARRRNLGPQAPKKSGLLHRKTGS